MKMSQTPLTEKVLLPKDLKENCEKLKLEVGRKKALFER